MNEITNNASPCWRRSCARSGSPSTPRPSWFGRRTECARLRFIRQRLDRERRHDHANSFHHLAHNLDEFSCPGLCQRSPVNTSRSFSLSALR
jgi:hypothetical protein